MTTCPTLNLHFLVQDEHSVDRGDSGVGLFLGLVLHVAVALGLTLLVNGNLAADDVAERAERVVQVAGETRVAFCPSQLCETGLPCVESLVKVLDEDVADTSLADAGVAVLPHDAARAATDFAVVESVQGALG